MLPQGNALRAISDRGKLGPESRHWRAKLANAIRREADPDEIEQLRRAFIKARAEELIEQGRAELAAVADVDH